MLDENLIHQIICLLNLDDLIKIRRCSQQVYDATERIFIEKDCDEPISTCRNYSMKDNKIMGIEPLGNIPIRFNINVEGNDFRRIRLPPNSHTVSVYVRKVKDLTCADSSLAFLENVPVVIISTNKKCKGELDCIIFRNSRSLKFQNFIQLTNVHYLFDLKGLELNHRKFKLSEYIVRLVTTPERHTQYVADLVPKWNKIHVNTIYSQEELDLISNCSEIFITNFTDFSSLDVSKLTVTNCLTIPFYESFNGHIWQNQSLTLDAYEHNTSITPDTVLKNVDEIEIISCIVTQTEPIFCTLFTFEGSQLFCTQLTANTFYFRYSYCDDDDEERKGVIYSPVDIDTQNVTIIYNHANKAPETTRFVGVKKLKLDKMVFKGDFSFQNENTNADTNTDTDTDTDEGKSKLHIKGVITEVVLE